MLSGWPKWVTLEALGFLGVKRLGRKCLQLFEVHPRSDLGSRPAGEPLELRDSVHRSPWIPKTIAFEFFT